MGVVAVVWSPIRTLREVAGGHSALPGFIVVSVHAAFSLVVSSILVLSGATRRQLEQGFEQPGRPTLPPAVLESLGWALEIGTLIIAFLLPFLIWVVVSLLMQLGTRLFGGAGPRSSMVGMVGVAQVSFLSAGS